MIDAPAYTHGHYNSLTIVVLTYPALAPYIAGENNYYLMVMFFSILGLSVIRFIGSFIYLLGYWRDTYASCRCC